MRFRIALATATAFLALGSAAANAGTVKLKDLLTDGYVIVGTAVAPSSVTSNALGSPNQPDELVLTLQRNGSIGFCHFLYVATYSYDTIPDAGCFVPGYVDPAAASSASSQEAPPPSSSEPASLEPAPASSEAPPASSSAQ